jgi:SP family arabinose:H+ symporter-like MFS transporter
MAVKEIGEIKSDGTEIKGKFRDLFRKNVRYIILVGIILAVFQQISGANAVFFYAPMIFEKAGMSIQSQLIQQILIGTTNLVFTLVAMRLVDHLGRKKLMVGGSFMLAIWLLVIAMFYHFRIFNGIGLTMFILLFIATFAVSLAPVTWVLISEIFPARIRGTAMSIATAMLWVACFSLTFIFPVLFGSQNHEGLLSPTGNFLLFSGINFLYFLILLKAIPETKGKSLERIEQEFTHLKASGTDKSLA